MFVCQLPGDGSAVEANIATYNTDDKYYNFHTSGVIDSDACPDTQVTMLM